MDLTTRPVNAAMPPCSAGVETLLRESLTGRANKMSLRESGIIIGENANPTHDKLDHSAPAVSASTPGIGKSAPEVADAPHFKESAVIRVDCHNC